MRKHFLVWSLLAVSVCSFACKKQTPTPIAAAPSPTPANVMPPQAQPHVEIGKPYPGVGVVKLINRPEGWIEILHEEIPGLMPAMEMEWSVQKRSMLEKVKVGDKVNFTVVETGKGEIITELKKVE